MGGLIHVYHGYGKGKTTAAVGLAVRAAGAGKKVLFVQFLKQGNSSELNILKQLKQVKTYALGKHYNFYKKLSEQERFNAQRDYTQLFDLVLAELQTDTDLLVLDEIIPACHHQLIPESKLIAFLHNKPKELEVVLTGRNPSEAMLQLADYITEMKKIKHPFDQGIKARLGVEF